MSAEPYDWNVVVAGYWNPAILTPSGIAKRVFGLPDGTPIKVEVPIDSLAPCRVRHEGLIVTAESNRLTIFTEKSDLDHLEQAKVFAAKAIEGLPETPFIAAGFNIKIKFDVPPDFLLKNVLAPLDNSLSDAGFKIHSRCIRRSLEFSPGVLNLEVRQGATNEIRIELNFHRQSSNFKDLVDWLKKPITDVKSSWDLIVERVTGIKLMEVKG